MKIKTLVGISITLSLTLFAAVGLATEDQARPSAFFPETRYECSAVLDGTKVVHDFVIQNKGTATLKVERVKTG